MPPKKSSNEPSKKTVEKKKERVIEVSCVYGFSNDHLVNKYIVIFLFTTVHLKFIHTDTGF